MPGLLNRVVEQYSWWLLGDLVGPHTLGRSFYMRPGKRPTAADRSYSNNEAFWSDVLSDRLGAERTVRFFSFNLFEWIPRNPGLFHTFEAEAARGQAQHYVREMARQSYEDYLGADGAPPDNATSFRNLTTAAGSSERTLVYTPEGKISMLRGGLGCIRLKPLQLKSGETKWLMSATSSRAPDEGIPLLVGSNDYQRIVEDLERSGAVCCDLLGRTRFVSEEFCDLFSVQNGIPRLYVEVSELQPHGAIEVPGQVSVAASFLSDFAGEPRIYASYVTFDPGALGLKPAPHNG